MNVATTTPTSPPTQLHLLSLNIWCLKFLSAHRLPRCNAIAAHILSLPQPPTILCLQECWTQRDYAVFTSRLHPILPYSKLYHSGMFGSGLAIFSAHPIEESSMFAYPLNGRPTAFFRGDWFVGKGVACARMRLPGSLQAPAGEVVEVFCTHLHAPYEREPNDSYLCHRTAQAWEIAKLMRHATERGHLAVGMGDFNMVPLSLAHTLITAHGMVEDVWRVLHPDSSLGAAIDDAEKARGRPVPTARFNLDENGATCDSVLNSWRFTQPQRQLVERGKTVEIPLDAPDARAKRLDYIFVGQPAPAPSRWSVTDVRVGMTHRPPPLGHSLSDHFSVEATLTRSAPPSAAQPSAPPRASLAPETYDEILAMIVAYVAREKRQRRLRLGHFVCSVCISVGCLVAVWWAPRNYVSFVLMLVSTLGLAAGVVDGLIGGLFVGQEMRALKEFRWEVEKARARARGKTREREGAGREALECNRCT